MFVPKIHFISNLLVYRGNGKKKTFCSQKYLSAYLTPDCNNIYIIGRHQFFLNLHIVDHNISAEAKLAYNTLWFNMPHIHLNQRVVCCFIIPLQLFIYFSFIIMI